MLPMKTQAKGLPAFLVLLTIALLVLPVIHLFGEEGAEEEIGKRAGGTDPVYWVHEATPENLGMIHSPGAADPGVKALGSLQAARAYLWSRGKSLRFIMNGGMYHQDLSPVGLYVEEGQTRFPLNLDRGWGNFFLQPNGVFFVTDQGKPGILPSQSYPPLANIRFATQSGPMLVIGGRINRRFRPSSDSRRIRNAVGVSEEGKVWFVLSREEVSFYELAAFLQSLGAEDALYLDGTVSNAYTPEEGYLRPPNYPYGVMIYEISAPQ
jgi:uncharacterized protein YigE (DUF2233 family)